MNLEISTPPPATSYLGKRPWLFVVAAFALMLAAWTAMFVVAASNPVKRVPLETAKEVGQKL